MASAQRPGAAVVAALLFNPMLGSLYAWSVFLDPLEAELGLPRAKISGIFSIAIFCFTVGMIFAPFANKRMPTAFLPMVATIFCVMGLSIAAMADNVPLLTFGYGVLFGYGSGFGYSVTLQLINHALADRRGLANGLGFGAFPLGAIVFSFVFGMVIDAVGPQNLFGAAGVILVLSGCTAALLVKQSAINLRVDTSSITDTAPTAPSSQFVLLWSGFFLAAAGGMMTIGHAAGILLSQGGDVMLAMIGAVFVNIGNAGGRFCAGWACDHFSPGRVAMISHIAALIGFMILATDPGPIPALIAVASLGLSYGIASGAYPSTVSIFFGIARYGRNIGILVTAWGVAGLSTPWIGGWLFDLTGEYILVSVIGLAVAAAGIVVTFFIKDHRPQPN